MTKVNNNLQNSHDSYLTPSKTLIIIALVLTLHIGVLFALWIKKTTPIMLPQIAPLQIQFIDSQQLTEAQDSIDMATNDKPSEIVSTQTQTPAQKNKATESKPTQTKPSQPKTKQTTIIAQEQTISDLSHKPTTTDNPTLNEKTTQHQETQKPTHETTKTNKTNDEQPPTHHQNQTEKTDKNHHTHDNSSVPKVGLDNQQHSNQPSNDQQNKTTKSGESPQQAMINDWQKQVIIAIERKLQYPAQALTKKWGGKPQVRITIDPSGNVLSVTLAKSSGKTILDNEAIATAKRASPLPKPPSEIMQGSNQKSFVIPIRFDYKKYQ